MVIGVAWTMGVYSIPGHKEWRFIHPILPLLHIFATKSLFELSNTSNQRPPPDKIQPQQLSQYLPPIRPAHLYLLLLTLPASAYVILFHNSEPIRVMHYLRGLPADELRGSIGFLMPCHSTPAHAYLHREELAIDSRRLWALGCEPPLG
jgi:phosphatidylinositol glycan class B